MAEQISSSDKPITLADWHIIYQRLLPYLGGNKAVDGNPIGTVITHLGATPPAGYLVCDGSKLSATAFPLLFDVLKELPSATRASWGDADWVTEFNVPNLYGEFPRFSGTNSHTNQGNGGAVGVHQDGTQLPITFTANGTYIYSYKNGTNGNNFPTNADNLASFTDKYVTITSGQSAQDNNAKAVITRPTNTSFLPCIKYTYVTQEVEYSDVEHIVGTWVDGKPLYEKTIIGTFDGTQTPSVNHGISNLEHIVDYNCMTTSKSAYSYAQRSIPFVYYADQSDNFDASLNIYANSINFLLGAGFAEQQETFRITIRYTKTS